ncbi:hypothetical protein EZV62_011447 [Acer yangbiense]|uniref:TOD1/MUCI70 glycosyltransferase-like domain-containing protein n=1 Tax=Acer yangbiense TaxID=1000413 RepID=A0A5C7I4J1_9ROSI|nr:hypothetical protein EZV62_011447 [Acer yangbiense]
MKIFLFTTYIYLESLIKAGNVEKADEVFNQMQSDEAIGIDARSCNTMLSGYLSSCNTISSGYLASEKYNKVHDLRFDLMSEKDYDVEPRLMDDLEYVLRTFRKDLIWNCSGECNSIPNTKRLFILQTLTNATRMNDALYAGKNGASHLLSPSTQELVAVKKLTRSYLGKSAFISQSIQEVNKAETQANPSSQNAESGSNMRIGIWRIVVIHNPPYKDSRRTGKVNVVVRVQNEYPIAEPQEWVPRGRGGDAAYRCRAEGGRFASLRILMSGVLKSNRCGKVSGPSTEELQEGYNSEDFVREEIDHTRIPKEEERASNPKGKSVAFHPAFLEIGARLPLQTYIRRVLREIGIAPAQLNPNA